MPSCSSGNRWFGLKNKSARIWRRRSCRRSSMMPASKPRPRSARWNKAPNSELAIEENLRRAFPLDTIEDVKKGQRGGDVLQHVVTRNLCSTWKIRNSRTSVHEASPSSLDTVIYLQCLDT